MIIFFALLFFIPAYFLSINKILLPNSAEIKILFSFYYRIKFLIKNLYRNYDTSLFSIPEQPLPFDKCELCTFQPKMNNSTANSSSRDAILTIGMNRLVNLFLFIKTLRTTGSKCRFILFLDDSAVSHYDRNFFSTVENCGVEIVNFHALRPFADIACLRFQIYLDFLEINRHLFDRIYLCDLFDTVVQHDPFTTDFGDMLYLCDEGIKICDDSINSYWLSKCISDMAAYNESFNFSDEVKSNIFKKNILNSGLVAGSIKNMINYCRVMSKMIDNEQLRLIAIYDQGFHNLIVYTGLLDGLVNYKIENVDSELFASIGVFITRTNNIEHNDKEIVFGEIKRNSLFPGILHQFERSAKIKNSLMKFCPNKNNFTDYMRNKH